MKGYKLGGIIGGIVSGRIKAVKIGARSFGGVYYEPMTDAECLALRARYGGIWEDGGQDEGAHVGGFLVAAARLEEKRQEIINGGGFLETARRYEMDTTCIFCDTETDGADICDNCYFSSILGEDDGAE